MVDAQIRVLLDEVKEEVRVAGLHALHVQVLCVPVARRPRELEVRVACGISMQRRTKRKRDAAEKTWYTRQRVCLESSYSYYVSLYQSICVYVSIYVRVPSFDSINSIDSPVGARSHAAFGVTRRPFRPFRLCRSDGSQT
jgi:hypothetical protein